MIKIENIYSKGKKAGQLIINCLFMFCIFVIVFFCLQIFLFTSFKIPSDSMKPGLVTGDNVLVNKAIYGARLFNIMGVLNNKYVTVYRISGISKIKHNDIMVFNFPHPNTWDRIEMHLMKYYIKRCIGLPGDSLQITNGFYINNNHSSIGNINSQKDLSLRAASTFEEGVYNAFPFDSILSWNIQSFGPLYIPKKNDILPMNRTYYILYKKLIEWEQQTVLSYQDSIVYLKGQPLDSYQFQKSYYFMAGDKVEDSQDSRYWGLLPEEYIVGKAWVIWKSIDPYTGKFRWERFLKRI